MRAVAYETYGEPWDVVHVEDLPEPELGAGDVLITLEAAPIHIADLLAMRKALPFFAAQPGVGGFEGVGRISALGADVTNWAAGDRVFLPIGYGAWRERHSVRASTLLRAPENAAAEQLALVPINMATAYLMLHAYDTVSAGDWVLQNAANSNVGHYFEIFAKRAGINVINVVRRSALIDTLKNQGRSHVLVDSDSLAGDVAAITSDPPKIALDAIGGPATTRLGACVAMHGLVLSYGFLSKQPHALAYPDLVFRNVRLRGVLTNYAMERLDADGLARMRSEMDAVMNSGQLSAEIAGIYTFSEAAEALRHAAKTGADRHGKVILKPD